MNPCFVLHLTKKPSVGWGGGSLNALCQFQQLPLLDCSRLRWVLVTAVGINKDFCCWQENVKVCGFTTKGLSCMVSEKAGNLFQHDWKQP